MALYPRERERERDAKPQKECRYVHERPNRERRNEQGTGAGINLSIPSSQTLVLFRSSLTCLLAWRALLLFLAGFGTVMPQLYRTVLFLVMLRCVQRRGVQSTCLLTGSACMYFIGVVMECTVLINHDSHNYLNMIFLCVLWRTVYNYPSSFLESSGVALYVLIAQGGR